MRCGPSVTLYVQRDLSVWPSSHNRRSTTHADITSPRNGSNLRRRVSKTGPLNRHSRLGYPFLRVRMQRVEDRGEQRGQRYGE